MTLHSKARGYDLDGQYLSINPLCDREGEGVDVLKHHMPDSPMLPRMASEIIRDELMLDGNARLNLATFVTTWMEPEAEKLMAGCLDKNTIDRDEYPQAAEMEMRCGDNRVRDPREFPGPGAFVTRDQGLSLVRESCRRMDEQVSSLRQEYDETPLGDERKPGDARVLDFRNSPSISAEGAPPASVCNTQASARAANEGTA